MLLLIVVNQSMRIMMVLAVAGSRCQSSAACNTLSEIELSTSTIIVLLKNGVLFVVPRVQIKIFKLILISIKLSRFWLTLASWCSCECCC